MDDVTSGRKEKTIHHVHRHGRRYSDASRTVVRASQNFRILESSHNFEEFDSIGVSKLSSAVDQSSLITIYIEF